MMADKIKKLREGHNMTQRQLAQLCGVRTATISKWERGITAPRLPRLRKLADFFRVDMNYFEVEAPSPKEYYYSREVTTLAQEMFDNPSRRILFDSTKDLSEEAIEEVQKFIDYQKEKERKKF